MPNVLSSIPNIFAAISLSSTTSIRRRPAGGSALAIIIDLEFAGGRLQNWQTNSEFAPFSATRAVGFHRAAVHFDEPLHERQANSQANLGSFHRAIDLREHVEDAIEHLGGDADAGIGDGYDGLGILSFGRQHDLPPRGVYFAALLSRLETT